ncbi:MAG: ATP-binding cassette domain-containing protein [Clostridia bacterium]|nr:ATP-binding cassette domain-containing protein [Clostridia bacterium]
MLEVKKLEIRNLKGSEIVKDVNFTLKENDKLAIIGEEGNGKSTLLKAIYDKRMIEDYASIASGEIIHNGAKLGYLEQFLNKEWNDKTVEEFFLREKPDSEIDFESYANLYQLEKIMRNLNLEESYLQSNKKIGTLSGGEKVKLQLAKIVWKEPDVLLLDEPTNDLDIATLMWLENFILTQTIPILYISHDEVLLENTANAILHIEKINNKENARVTYEHIGYVEYVDKRIHLLNRQESIAQNEKREHEKQLEKFRKMYERVNHELNTVSRQDPSKGRLLKKKMKAVKSFEKRLDNTELTKRPEVEEQVKAKFHNDDAIHDKKVVLNFSLEQLEVGGKELSQHIILQVIGKEKVCIIGENGCGKTTLLKCIYDSVKERTDIKFGYMPQNYDDIFESYKTPMDFLTKEYTKEEKTNAMTYLSSMKFTNQEILGKISNLSGGQKAKLFLVGLIMQKCDVLLLDEPTRNLSPLSIPVINTLLQNYNGSIISVSHDRKYITQVCDTVYYLDKNGLQKQFLNE